PVRIGRVARGDLEAEVEDVLVGRADRPEAAAARRAAERVDATLPRVVETAEPVVDVERERGLARRREVERAALPQARLILVARGLRRERTRRNEQHDAAGDGPDRSSQEG